MIAVIATGVGSIILIAIVVGIIDANQASSWRRVAAERRREWEARQPQLHGVVDPNDVIDADSWDDD